MEKNELKFLVDFVIESDAIEGLDNDRKQVENEIVKEDAKSLKNYQSFIGHAGVVVMLRKFADSRGLLNGTLVKHIQRLIVEEQPQKGERQLPFHQIGYWREHNLSLVWIDRRIGFVSKRPVGEKWEGIPSKMRDLIAEVSGWQRFAKNEKTFEEIVRFIGDFHYKYECIHPFADGNGRSGRALVYFLYRYWRLQPFIFSSIGRQLDYYPCLKQDSSSMMEEYFLKRSMAA